MELKTELVVEWLEFELTEVLRFFVVGVICGGSLGCDLPQSCGLRGHVWLVLLG